MLCFDKLATEWQALRSMPDSNTISLPELAPLSALNTYTSPALGRVGGTAMVGVLLLFKILTASSTKRSSFLLIIIFIISFSFVYT